MFPSHRTIAALALATTTLAGGLGSAAAPQEAQAAGCQWQIPSQIRLTQSDGWKAYNTSGQGSGYRWRMWATREGGPHALAGTLKLTRFDRTGSKPQVRFTITWGNGHAGVYSGRIDRDGFVSGSMYDRFDSRNRARFHFDEVVDCA